METLWRDLRHAARALRRRPAVTAVSAVTLAVGLGGATSIFSVADAVVLRPLPFRDPDRLVVVSQSDLRRNQPFVEISYPAFRAWREEGRAFEALAALPSSNQPFVLTGHGEPRRLMGLPVTAGFFDVLWVLPARRAARVEPAVALRAE